MYAYLQTRVVSCKQCGMVYMIPRDISTRYVVKRSQADFAILNLNHGHENCDKRRERPLLIIKRRMSVF